MFGVRLPTTGALPAAAVFDAPSGIELLGPLSIAGDVRLDAREDLLARLPRRPAGDAALSDKSLCLQAYAAWGDKFVEFLAGDFCFALWDDSRHCLRAARDQLGIKPLFHATAGGMVLVSDSLDWITGHAAVPRDLDEVWIGDFLTVNASLDFERTVWRHVHRVPPAHLLKLSGDGQSVTRYWRLEIGEPIHFRNRGLYTERFVELVGRAVRDRLPPGRVGISLSGGLDSTTLAACTVAAVGDPSRVVGECYHYERLMPDEEARFARVAAERLGIELRLEAVDDCTYDPQWRMRAIRTAEPTLAVVDAHFEAGLARGMAGVAGVWFFGEGPDNALAFDRDPYFSWLRSRRDWRGLARAALDYAGVKGLPGWRATVQRHLRPRVETEGVRRLPRWLDPEFERRLRVAERIRDVGVYSRHLHPWHPSALGSFADPIWPALFDKLREGAAMGPFEWRHPFLDLRVLEYMMALPPVPWGWRKHLLREAMRGRLPAEILAREKTPLAVPPLASALGEHELPPLAFHHRFAAFVVAAELPARALPSDDPTRLVAAHALDYWLTQE